MAAPTLIVEQYQYSDTGVLLNGDDSALPFVDIESVQGLDMPEFRNQSHDREGLDGGYVDAPYLTSRTVTIEGTVYANPTNMEDYLDQLKANFAPTRDDKPLYFKTDNATLSDRLVFGKSLGFRYTKDANRRLGIAKFQVQIMCGDPRIYSVVEINQIIAWGAGAMNVNVGGNRTTPAILTLRGPVTSPTVTHSVSGTVFSFSGFTLPAGNTLTINLNTRQVLQNGTTNRRHVMTLTGDWYELSPGTNTFTRTGSGTTAATEFQVTARSAWQ